jgi:enoyl-CoA hydratase/carnithine racemase
MRFAARESTVFGQFEPSLGAIPGGGAAQHLTHLVGRARALEVMLSAVKDRVDATALAPAEDFRRDSDLFGEGMRSPEAQRQIGAALQHGLQTRDAEMDLARVLGELSAR